MIYLTQPLLFYLWVWNLALALMVREFRWWWWCGVCWVNQLQSLHSTEKGPSRDGTSPISLHNNVPKILNLGLNSILEIKTETRSLGLWDTMIDTLRCIHVYVTLLVDLSIKYGMLTDRLSKKIRLSGRITELTACWNYYKRLESTASTGTRPRPCSPIARTGITCELTPSMRKDDQA